MTRRGLPTVTVLVPTLARSGRRELLLRALASIRSQDGVAPTALVIVNGADADPDLLTRLATEPDVVVLRIPQRGIPAAFRAGRPAVATSYFAALDDDDILLPGALTARVAALTVDDTRDAVVTDGFIRSAAGDRRMRENFLDVAVDPVREMFRGNWLLPGSWLCRSDRVGAWLFEEMPDHRECTWIGLQLATRARLAFLPTPTLVYHDDTPDGAHRHFAYCAAQPAAIRRFLTLPLPPDVRAQLRHSMAAAYHQVAHRLLIEEGRRGAALRWHLRSLLAPGGRRHLLFTRKLLWPRRWLARLVRRAAAVPPVEAPARSPSA
ncbi:MAG TPA: glycosyltransferase family 2 protein [Gemmatimonadales bacterium]|nr:glycosyltransferase family 2 protein [Gemmatimonadales bacterium]